MLGRSLNPASLYVYSQPAYEERRNTEGKHSLLSSLQLRELRIVSAHIPLISRHRRNHSQHVLKDVIPPLEQLMVEKEGYLQKAKIADGGKKLRKNWSTSWIVLSSRKIEFYKESKQQALANMKTGHKPESVDLCGAHIEWAKEKSSRKNVFQGYNKRKQGSGQVTDVPGETGLLYLSAALSSGTKPLHGAQQPWLPSGQSHSHSPRVFTVMCASAFR
ncbi:rho GTPase-activating protein 15-like isoform X2 [Panthera uncia]|uniref:rho GTPase-activating protein 15-like isoform X2 n=1 Tax=Panthera uncia TaxID=29064 RepID=UPI0020FFC1F2|nr:rho GTPase-activating protein 15-like isoform X2 [Panthera uncia]